jgi:hypothetical protein
MHLGADDLPYSQSMSHPADKPLSDKYGDKCFFFNLGPTGIRARINTDAPMHLEVKYVFQDSRSPAAGKVDIGDVIVGANGKLFKTPAVFHRKKGARGVKGAGPMLDMAVAIEDSQGRDGRLELIVQKRGSGRKSVVLQLEPVGRFSPTWPWDCPRSDALRKKLVDHMLENGPDKGRMWLRIQYTLSLWASGDRRALPLVQSLGQSLCKSRVDPMAGGMCTWTWGYMGIFLGEYYNAFRDKAAVPAAEDLVVGYETSQDWRNGGCSHRPFPAIQRRIADGGPKGYGAMAGPGGLSMLAQSIFRHCGLPYSELAYNRTHVAFLMTAGGNASGGIAYGFRGWPGTHIRLKDAKKSPCQSKLGIGFICPTGMEDIGPFEVEKWDKQGDGSWKMTLVSPSNYPWLFSEAKQLRVYDQGTNRRLVVRPEYPPEPTSPYGNDRRGAGHVAPVGMGTLAHIISNKGNTSWGFLAHHMATCCASSGLTLWDGHAAASMHAFFGALGAARADERDFRRFLDDTKAWIILSETHDGQGLVEQPFGAQRNSTCSVSRDRKQYSHVALMVLSLPMKKLLITGAETNDGSSALARAPSSSSGSSTRRAPAAAPTKVAPKVDADVVAKFDIMLMENLMMKLFAGKRPTVYLRSEKDHATIKELEGIDILVVVTAKRRKELKIEWKELSLADKRGLALSLLTRGKPEDHALVAFYSLAIGDDNMAAVHMSLSGDVAAEVRKSFE